ncbi:MAG: phenylacetate--CoA ligase family protein [Boseongicola sp.]|nr:phenylacetate--CoA ligase family protein [Boseongicola sp.]MDD9979566.1 phenylacetate--CoA ligase family protein [Boseongicola sp.]
MNYTAEEQRSQDERHADQLGQLRGVLGKDSFDFSELSSLPLLRKSDLISAQAKAPPFGAIAAKNVSRVYQSPGPIYEPGGTGHDWWRIGRFLNASGVGADDIVLNTFSYHFTPAGAMFENAAEAVGASVFAAGPGQTVQQAEVAAFLGATTYAGTPDFLGAILSKADEFDLDVSSLNKATVSAGPLFPHIRQGYADRGITCRQCYATADIGLIAYETEALDGMVVDESVIVEIVTPGTGDPVEPGDIGELVVTVLNPDYPLVRFATGDLSSVMPGQSPCGRTNMRIAGWKGRADQATKVKGMFVRPEQVARLVERHPEIHKARVEVGHDGASDTLTVKLETDRTEKLTYSDSVKELLKLRADVELFEKGQLPRDGLVIADLRPVEG